jgi:hypothetical protein
VPIREKKSLVSDQQLAELDEGKRLFCDKLMLDAGVPIEHAIGRRIVDQVVSEMMQHGSSATLDRLFEADFTHRPPTPREFIEDDYYLGRMCQPDPIAGTTGLFEKWREAFMRDFDAGSPIRQIVLTGGIGMGKTWFGVVCALYKICFMLCLRDPVQYYGLSATSSITFSFFSVTQKQVGGGIFGDCLRFLQSSPFFREHVKTNLDRKFADRRIELSHGMVIEAGSQLSEALGRNVLVSVVDEANFRLEKNAAQGAKDLVNAIHRRVLSRFRDGDNHPGLMILISSAQNDTDFLIQYIREKRHDPTVRIYDYPWWEVAGPYKVNYSGKRFAVDVGDTVIPPRIVDDQVVVQSIPSDRLMMVPDEHREEFETDLTGSIRDIGGHATGRSAKLFSSMIPLLNCIVDDTENPFTTDSIPLGIGVSARQIHEYVNLDRLLTRRDGRVVPLRHPYSPRFIHMDMSTGAEDAMGLCMVHPVTMSEVQVYDKMTHRASRVFKPVFEVDFAIRIVRDPSKREIPIDFGRIREFVGWLANHAFRLECISCDLAALSTEMRSILTMNGFNTSYVSVDRKKDPYYQLKQMIDEGRLHMFDHDYLLTELQYLEDGPDKVDHPEKFSDVHIRGQSSANMKGSKDLADGLCGALFEASQSEKTAQLASDPRSRVEVLKGMVAQQGAEDTALSKFGEDAPHDSIRTL